MKSNIFLSATVIGFLTLFSPVSTVSAYDAENTAESEETNPCDEHYDNLQFSRSAQQTRQACRDLKMNRCSAYFGRGSQQSRLISKKCGKIGQLRGKISKINPLRGIMRG